MWTKYDGCLLAMLLLLKHCLSDINNYATDGGGDSGGSLWAHRPFNDHANPQ